MYDSEAEIAQAKRDCVALAEEVQRLRGEVQRERTGRKKAMAAKKIAGMPNRSSRCQVLTKFLSATFPQMSSEMTQWQRWQKRMRS